MARLAPSDRAFLLELSRIAENAAGAASVLRDQLAGAKERVACRVELAELASETDAIVAAVTRGVPQAMVPPIDVEDATELALRLRVVVKGTHRVGQLADIVPYLADEQESSLTELLVQATDSVEGAVTTMTDGRSALDFAGDVRRTAREGDRMYVEGMAVLLTAGSEPLRAVRHGVICGPMRVALCDCVAAIAVVERVVLKRF